MVPVELPLLLPLPLPLPAEAALELVVVVVIISLLLEEEAVVSLGWLGQSTLRGQSQVCSSRLNLRPPVHDSCSTSPNTHT